MLDASEILLNSTNEKRYPQKDLGEEVLRL